MRAVVMFAPGFLAFGKAFAKELQQHNVEIIALATTRKTYKALKKDKTFKYVMLDCLEDREREWLDTPYDPAALKRFEDTLGTKVIDNMLIIDRLVGSGLVSCARPIETELTKRTRNAGTMRAYITGMLKYFEDLINEQKPDSAFLYAIAGAPAAAIAYMMHHIDIPVLKLQHTRVEDCFMVDTSMTGVLDPLWDRFFAGARGGKSSQARAQAWLEEYRSRDKKPDYFTSNVALIKKSFSPLMVAKKTALSAARVFYYLAVPGQKQLRAETGRYRLTESFMLPLRARKMRRESAYSDYESLRNSDFIYFPLHVDPESSTMHLAPDFTDQPAVIEMLAKRRPLHMNVLVKEHPNMLGRRPRGFYERIERLPGVYLVSPNISGREMTKDARLVFTITGTTAWEAVALQVPALVLGDLPFLPFATKMGKGMKLGRFETLAEDIREAVDLQPVPDDELLRFLSVLFDETFSLSSKLFWGEVGDDVVAQNSAMVRGMADQFMERYRECKELSRAA